MILAVVQAWPNWALGCLAGLFLCTCALTIAVRFAGREGERNGSMDSVEGEKASDMASGSNSGAPDESSSLGREQEDISATTRGGGDGSGAIGFTKFQIDFLVVYTMLMFADWLQGTHMYTLYQGYGVDVSSLYITGFGSSAILGTFVGAWADRHGRKRGCVAYCMLELVINFLEHFNSMPLLLLGRLMGGLSTSLLFSTFESWMVCEHKKRGFTTAQMRQTFSRMSALNGASAILAGIVAQAAVDIRENDDIAPFQLAMVFTAAALLPIAINWPENRASYGDGDGGGRGAGKRAPDSGGNGSGDVNANATPRRSKGELRRAMQVLRSNRQVTCLGLCGALFEGAVYSFVFLWVPALQQAVPIAAGGGESLPTGVVFSCFMLCISMGGLLFDLTVGRAGYDARSVLVGVAATGAASLGVCAMTNDYRVLLASFFVLETCVGLFNPLIGVLRSDHFPTEVQSTLMNVFRVPLNAIVVCGTKLADSIAPASVFALCAITMAAAATLAFDAGRHQAVRDRSKVE